MSSLFTRAALGAYGLLITAGAVLGARTRICPERCSVSGPNPANWSAYHNLNQFNACPLVVLQAFSIYTDVDNASLPHGIYACSSYGADFVNMAASSEQSGAAVHGSVNATYEVGWWDDGRDFPAADIRSASGQLREYLAGGHAADPDGSAIPAILYARSGPAAVGLYIGQGLQSEGVGTVALKMLEDNLEALNASSRSVAMQFCQPGFTGEHIFGFFATSNKTFAPVQQALRSWANATCLSFPNSREYEGQAVLTSPIVTTSPGPNTTTAHINSTTSFSTTRRRSNLNRVKLHARGQCSTVQVQSGDSCGSLATKCGISGNDFMKYNSAICSSLQPGQHVCCSAGDLPDFRPKPNADGTCHVYYVVKNDNCASIAAANSLTVDDLEEFNKKTWAWGGCASLQFNLNICLSEGEPPMPAVIPDAQCGPQVPGTQRPSNGTELAALNPCPLNACCDVWGWCGTTAEFCTDTSTGNPGTARPLTNGCISNCGTNIVRSGAPATFRKVAYFEGYGLNRDCLLQDALQIDGSRYTHLHFGFGTLTPDFQVQVGDVLSSYEFGNFKRISGPAKILSFGGWDFSTNPNTYMIFREGVGPANRLKTAQNIADFIKDHGLDGVDIDWEYPAAPDIPNIPAGTKEEADNYLAFLVVLKNLLPGKSVSIAAPASYHYLKAFPIDKIAKVVDYIVFMTYDLHGQWDAESAYSQEGCVQGNCLRSQVNLTETIGSLVMITKAGVPSNKVVVGVTSYGRSFHMAQAGCYGPDCLFTGSRWQSDAKKGRCTATAGYISNAEIREIAADASRVTAHFHDAVSDSNILVYDQTEWVGYMDDGVKASRQLLYTTLNLGGTTNWATDLESFHDVPRPSESWLDFKLSIKANKNPYSAGDRHGNWTDLTCEAYPVQPDGLRSLTPSERWAQLDCGDAWNDVIDVWKNVDRKKTHYSFTQSVALTLNGPQGADCGSLESSNNCHQTLQCDGFANKGSGPAGYEIWNSFVVIHNMYQSYHDALYTAAAAAIDPALDDFENRFAPVPPPKDDKALKVLLDLVTLGVSAVAAPFFNSYLAKLPRFIGDRADRAANIKDLTLLTIGQSVAIAKDLAKTPDSKWNHTSQAKLSNYLGQTITAWGNVTAVALKRLFNGNDESIDTLKKMLDDGKFISGGGAFVPQEPPGTSKAELQANIAKTFFAYAIPTAWHFSKQYAFVVDSGYDCGTVDPLGKYLSTDAMHRTSACYPDNGGKLYYLAAPKGDSKTCECAIGRGGCQWICNNSHFSLPPGLDALDGTNFGGVKIQDLIRGAVRTYQANGNHNGAEFLPDIENSQSFNDFMSQDVTTPGLIRIPVCSPEHAFKSWDTAGPRDDDPTYPCNIPKGPDYCQISSFENQTSAASPPVSDCLQIIKNIQGDAGASWTIGISGHRELVSYGECKFGVESVKGADGNVNFKVGAQDIIDLIRDAITRFGGGGKIGAKGRVDCSGNVHDTTIEWRIY